MLKKFVCLVLLIGLTVLCFTSFGCKRIAKSIEESKQFVYTLNEDGASYSVRSGNNYKYEKSDGKSLKIPSEYEDLPVTKISWGAFKNLGYVSVEIPKTVTVIGAEAFQECKQLKILEWHNGITEIGESAFRNCEFLQEIQIPESVEEIKTETFNGCKMLNFVILPNGLKKIDAHAFWFCESLESIELPNTVENIGFGAFANSAITYINQPDNLTSVGYKVFAETPYSDKYSGNIVDNRLMFGEFLIEDYNIGKKLVIPNGIKGLADMLYQNNSFESISIPESLQYLGSSTFRYANNPKEFIVNENNAKFTAVDGVLYNKDLTTLIKYPIAKEDESFSILQSVEKIGACAFENAKNLKQINFHDGVKVIGYNALTGLTELTCLEIPSTVEEFDFNYFTGCANLSRVTLPDCLTTIYSEMFAECYALESIVIPKEVVEIGDNAFMDCIALKSVSMGEKVRYIYDGAFRRCVSLESIVIPDSVIEINLVAFEDCSSLKTVTLGKEIKWITNLFYGCDTLERVILPTYEGWCYRKNPKADKVLLTDEFSTPEKVAQFLKTNSGWLSHD